MTRISLDHLGLLVRSAERSSQHFRSRGIEVASPEDFPGEGTREIYVGSSSQDGKVLLLESIGPGPYASALQRRGPGLHHVALRVEDLGSFVRSLGSSAWLLHPISLSSFAESETVWLARPGTPVLIELIASKTPPRRNSLVTKLGLPLSAKLLEALPCPTLETAEAVRIEIGPWAFQPRDVCE